VEDALIVLGADLTGWNMGWPLWLAAAGVFVMVGLLAAVPWLSRPAAEPFLNRTLMGGSTLYSRLLTGFRFVAVMPLLTLLPLLAVITSVTVQDRETPRVEALAESLATDVPRLIDGRVAGIEALAGHITAAGRVDGITLSDALLRHHASNPEFASLWIARPDGTVVVATAFKGSRAERWAGPVSGVAMMDAFAPAVAADGLYVSRVQPGAGADAAPMVFVSAPVRFGAEARWGFVQGLLNLRDVVGGLVGSGAVNTVVAVVTDEHHRVVLASPGTALAPLSDLSAHPLVTAAGTAGASGSVYGFSGTLGGDTERRIAATRPLTNGWQVYTLTVQVGTGGTLLIYMALGLVWALLAAMFARGIAPLYGHTVAAPLQKLDESLDIFDVERTISNIPRPPNDAPKEIRQVYSRVRESMRNSRDAHRNMVKAVNEGAELRRQLRAANGEGDRPPGLELVKEKPAADATWTGRIDSVTRLSGLDVFEGFFDEAWTLGVADGRPMAVVLVKIGSTDDRTLKLIAQKLTAAVGRTLDLVARIAAWEFGMILPDTDIKGGLAVAEKMHKALRAMPDLSVDVCFGVASIVPNDKGNAQSFFELCHRAAEAAQREGGGQIAFVTDTGKFALHASSDMIEWDSAETGTGH